MTFSTAAESEGFTFSASPDSWSCLTFLSSVLASVFSFITIGVCCFSSIKGIVSFGDSVEVCGFVSR